MGKTVTTIPATISRFTAVPINEVRKRRVAGYASWWHGTKQPKNSLTTWKPKSRKRNHGKC